MLQYLPWRKVGFQTAIHLGRRTYRASMRRREEMAKKIQNPMRCPATLLPTLYRSSDSTKSTVERPPTQESAGKSGLKLASSSLAAQLFTVHGDPWEWAEGCPAATLSESEASLDSKHRYARDEYVLGSQRTSSCDATLTPPTETPPPLGSQTHRSSFARLSACCARGLRTRSGSLSGRISGRCSLVRM